MNANSTYTSRDFEGLKYNVMEAKGNLFEAVPKLSEFDSFVQCKADDRDELIRYIVLMYDKKSPIIATNRNPEAKHLEAVRLSKLNRVGDFSDEIMDMVIEFLKDQNDLWWALIVSNEATFWDYQRMIAQPIEQFDGDKDRLGATSLKTKLLIDSEQIANRLEAYYPKVFIEQRIIEKAKSRQLTPETIAKQNV
jgi:hypothetical protein